jgi:septal ring factor EnvC (AmiA/AmiB activator)
VKNEEIMFDLIKEVREEQKEIRQDIHRQSIVFSEHMATDAKMYEELSKMNETLTDNTKSLQEHMKRTATLEAMWQMHQARLDDIQKPMTVKEAAGKFAKFCGFVSAVAGAIYGLSKFF